MPGIFFTNTWMLAAMAALAIPVLIHLLLKRKKKRLRFSTLQFFLKQDDQSSQRRKLRNWLLLAIRLFIVTLLVLAFARPYLPQSDASNTTGQRRQLVFVLDQSASMQAIGSDGQRWAQAKERVQKVIAGLKPDDRAALIGCANHAEVLSGFAPPAAAAKLLRDLQPTCGSSDLAEGLQQAVKLTTGGDPEAVATVYVVGDLQRSACHNLASCPVPQAVEIKLIAVGDLFAPNLALTQLQVDAHDGAKPQVVVANFSDEDSPNVNLDFSVDGKVVSSRSVPLKSGASTNVELPVPALRPGWHELKASLQAKDALAVDNARYATLFVPEPSRVLVVETRQTKRVFEEESFFIRAALDPTKDSTNSLQAAYNVMQTTPDELASRLSANPGQLPCDVVIVPGLKQIPSGSARVLTAFVQAGGGLLLFLGEGISANRYNSEFRDLLPAQLGNPDLSRDWGYGWRIGEYDTNTVVFAAFRLPNSGDLHIPEFMKRYGLTPTEGASQLAAFDDGLPLLLARTVGRGRVALVNTCADTAWNDWPKHKTFVPWLHGLGRYLAQKAGLDQIQETNSLVAGDEFDIDLGPTLRRSQIRLQPPVGKETLWTADDQGRLRDTQFGVPGIYSLRDRNDKELRRLAVNVAPRESDLAALPPTEFQQQLVRAQEPPKTMLGANLLGSRSNQKEFWSVLLLAVLGLLFIEAIVANRTLA